jgi:hypothetical protein
MGFWGTMEVLGVLVEGRWVLTILEGTAVVFCRDLMDLNLPPAAEEPL